MPWNFLYVSGFHSQLFCSPGDILQFLETFSVIKTVAGDARVASDTCEVEARDSIIHRTYPSLKKNHPA